MPKDNEITKAVGRGMAISASIVMRAWSNEMVAREILNCAGYKTEEDMKRDNVDQYDIDACMPVLDQQ